MTPAPKTTPALTRVRVVVATHRAGDRLIGCIERLAATNYAPLEIFVADDASSDGSVAAMAARFPSVRVVRSDVNIGFAGASNLGMNDLDRVDAIALINDDVMVEPGWLAPLVEALNADHRRGAVSPKLLLASRYDLAELNVVSGDRISLEPGARPVEGATEIEPNVWVADRQMVTVARPGSSVDLVNSTGVELNARWFGYDRGGGEVDRGQWDVAGEVWGWTGGAVLLSTQMLREVGIFDERLFMYCEDVELNLRARKAGWAAWYEPASVVRHAVGASMGRSDRFEQLSRRNRLVVVARHASRSVAVKLWAREVAEAGWLTIRDTLHAFKAHDRSRLNRPLNRWRSLVGALRVLRALNLLAR